MYEKIGNIIISTQQNEVTINTGRVEVRSLNQYDEAFLIEQYTRLLQDQKNITLFRDGKTWSTHQVRTFIKSEMKKWENGERFCIFSVYDTRSKKFMGSLHIAYALQEYATIGAIGHENVAEIAYILDSAFWGNGYGTEIAIIGIEYIKHIIAKNYGTEFKKLPVPKEAVATVHPLNEGSKRILQKIFVYQEPEEFIKYDGQPRLLFFTPLTPMNGFV